MLRIRTRYASTPATPIPMLPHLCLVISAPYHAYTPAVPSNVLNLSYLLSHYVWLLPQCLIICPIDHTYAHTHIGFHFSAIYHPYAPAPPPHLLRRLTCLPSWNALSCSQFPILMLTMNGFCTEGCSFPQLTILRSWKHLVMHNFLCKVISDSLVLI
ncbi:hypothetical protein O181_024086 [Austropuccinia psidii MF-1]|uniref:Uncharacterized protein n=1 Tax=Austropuccinia psidii MF-1 TaxID=1389203 RepID=A0A9Q3CKP6_9BASI|nr:hypothetical protein [Austropuccinia psidii MF-1]